MSVNKEMLKKIKIVILFILVSIIALNVGSLLGTLLFKFMEFLNIVECISKFLDFIVFID